MSEKRIPSDETLSEFVRLLDCLRYECSDAGLWPGTLTLSSLEDDTTAPGLLSELLWEYAIYLQEWGGRRHEARYEGRWLDEQFVSGWPVEWVNEIMRALRGLLHATARLSELWSPRGIDGIMDLTEFGVEDGQRLFFISGSVRIHNSPGEVLAEQVAPVPAEVAAVLMRCAERFARALDSVVATKAVHDFVPTAKQQKVLDVLCGRAMSLDELARAVDMERSSLCQRELPPLKERGLVVNNRRVGGYYRPDAPPKNAVAT